MAGTPSEASLDFYSILNVDREASPEELRSSYMQLASTIHPDKHHGQQEAMLHGGGEGGDSVGIALEELREKAETQFSLLDRSYRVLIDPAKRAAYDIHGVKGVQVLEADEASWKQICVARDKPAAVRELFRSLLRKERQADLQARYPFSGGMTVTCNGSRSNSEGGRLAPNLPQGMTVDLSDTDALRLGGFVLAKPGGPASGGATLRLQHQLEPRSWVAAEANLLHDEKVSISSGRLLSDGINGVAQLAVRRDGTPTAQVSTTCSSVPVLGLLHATMEVDPARGRRAAKLSLSHSQVVASGRGTLSAKVCVTDFRVQGSYQHTLGKRSRMDMEMKLGVGHGAQSVQVNHLWSLNEEGESQSRCGVKLSRQGVTVLLRLSRGPYHFELPILLYTATAPLSVAVSMGCACLADYTVYLLTRRFRKAQQQEKSGSSSSSSSGSGGGGGGSSNRGGDTHLSPSRLLELARGNAAAQVQLMAGAAQLKARREKERGGLVVLVARFGTSLATDYGQKWYLSPSSTPAGAKNIDVTIPLQFFVRGAGLRLAPGSKAGLLGFYDVQQGGEQPPQLYVRFQLHGQVYEITVGDKDPLVLPCAEAFHLGSAQLLQ